MHIEFINAVMATIYRGYLLFEINTKFISSNVLKISVILRVRNFNIGDEIFLVFTDKK